MFRYERGFSFISMGEPATSGNICIVQAIFLGLEIIKACV